MAQELLTVSSPENIMVQYQYSYRTPVVVDAVPCVPDAAAGRSNEHRVVHFSAVEEMLHNVFKFLEQKAKNWWARWVEVRRRKNPSTQDVWDLYEEAQQIILADLDQSEAIRLFLLQDLRDRYNALYPRQMLGPRRGWRRLRLSTNSEKRNRQNTNV